MVVFLLSFALQKSIAELFIAKTEKRITNRLMRTAMKRRMIPVVFLNYTLMLKNMEKCNVLEI